MAAKLLYQTRWWNQKRRCGNEKSNAMLNSQLPAMETGEIDNGNCLGVKSARDYGDIHRACGLEGIVIRNGCSGGGFRGNFHWHLVDR